MGQPDLLYRFMDLANHAAAATSSRGAAFGRAAPAPAAPVRRPACEVGNDQASYGLCVLRRFSCGHLVLACLLFTVGLKMAVLPCAPRPAQAAKPAESDHMHNFHHRA